MRAIDLHAGEEIIFEGHPSWRATLAFYVQGLLAVLVVGVIAAAGQRSAGVAGPGRPIVVAGDRAGDR